MSHHAYRSDGPGAGERHRPPSSHHHHRHSHRYDDDDEYHHRAEQLPAFFARHRTDGFNKKRRRDDDDEDEDDNDNPRGGGGRSRRRRRSSYNDERRRRRRSTRRRRSLSSSSFSEDVESSVSRDRFGDRRRERGRQHDKRLVRRGRRYSSSSPSPSPTNKSSRYRKNYPASRRPSRRQHEEEDNEDRRRQRRRAFRSDARRQSRRRHRRKESDETRTATDRSSPSPPRQRRLRRRCRRRSRSDSRAPDRRRRSPDNYRRRRHRVLSARSPPSSSSSPARSLSSSSNTNDLVVVSDDDHHHHSDHHHYHHHRRSAVSPRSRRRRRETHSDPGSSRSRSRDDSPADDDDDEDDDDDRRRDDTVGHYRGGPGSVLRDRYRVVRDVGLGTFGRVVECVDLRDRRRVAVKIVRGVRRYRASASIEADVLADVNARGGRGTASCVELLGHFVTHGGVHRCLVFERLGPSLYDYQRRHDHRPFALRTVRSLTRQLCDALDFLHGRVGLVHTDLKPENLLLASDDPPDHVPARRDPDVPGERRSRLVPRRDRVKVIDFGGATYDKEDAHKSSVVNTRQYRAPEVILGTGWSYPSDSWSAGCVAAELYTGGLLFATHDNAEHLALMERARGGGEEDEPRRPPPFPADMVRRSRLGRRLFDEVTGRHRRGRVLRPSQEHHVRKMRRLEEIVVVGNAATNDGSGRGSGGSGRAMDEEPGGGGGGVGDGDNGRRLRGHFLSLLKSLLTIDPAKRATASQALQSKFCSFDD